MKNILVRNFVALLLTFCFFGAAEELHQSGQRMETRKNALESIVLENGEQRTTTVNGTVQISCGNPSSEAFICAAYCLCPDTGLPQYKEVTGPTRAETWKKLDNLCASNCKYSNYSISTGSGLFNATSEKYCKKNPDWK